MPAYPLRRDGASVLSETECTEETLDGFLALSATSKGLPTSSQNLMFLHCMSGPGGVGLRVLIRSLTQDS